MRMKIGVWKVLLSSSRKIEPSSILPATFQKAAVLYEENLAFSRAFENIEQNDKKKCRRGQRKKRMRHNYQEKML